MLLLNHTGTSMFLQCCSLHVTADGAISSQVNDGLSLVDFLVSLARASAISGECVLLSVLYWNEIDHV